MFPSFLFLFYGIFIGPYTPRNEVWSYEGPEIVMNLILSFSFLISVQICMHCLLKVEFHGIFIGPYTPKNKVWSYEGPEIVHK